MVRPIVSVVQTPAMRRRLKQEKAQEVFQRKQVRLARKEIILSRKLTVARLKNKVKTAKSKNLAAKKAKKSKPKKFSAVFFGRTKKNKNKR